MKAIVALGLLSILSSQPAKYDLVWKPQKGQKLAYTVKLTGTLANQPFNFSSDVYMVVKKVEANGNYSIGTVYKNTVAKILGEVDKMPDEPEEITNFDARGRSLDPEDPNEESDAISEIIMRASETELPPNPVAVGESWTQEFAENKKIGLPKATATYKLLSTSNGKLYVSMNYSESSGPAPTKIRGIEVIRVSDGASLSIETQIENARVMEGLPATKLKLTMSLK